MFAKDLSNKIFSPPRHQGTKSNFNKHLLFVSWCLCGYSFRFIRVGCLIKVIFCTEICASMHCLLGSFITPPNKAYSRHLVHVLQFLSSVRDFYPGGSIRHGFYTVIRFCCRLQKAVHGTKMIINQIRNFLPVLSVSPTSRLYP
jgi:hypothetical protein